MRKDNIKRIASGIIISNLLGVLMVWLGIVLVKSEQIDNNSIYITLDFILTPIIMGLITPFFWENKNEENTLKIKFFKDIDLLLITFLIAIALCFLILKEGAICLLIVSPIILAMMMLGQYFGKIILIKRNNKVNVSFILMFLLLFIYDAFAIHNFQTSVSDSIIINSPVEKVWKNVAAYDSINEPSKFWMFDIGLPMPIATTVTGFAQGEKRNCIFSNGAVFNEYMDEYIPNQRLTFRITSQPKDPEIIGHLEIQKGQFVLKDNGNGSTTLTGTSWYKLRVYPAWYFNYWAESITRNVHLRAMEHIKNLSEKMYFNLIVKHFSFLKNIPLIPLVFDLLLILYSFIFRNNIYNLISKLETELLEWKNVKRVLHKYGGLQFNINNKELCHLHGNGLVDMIVKNDDYLGILNDGIATKHHIFKDSNWISLYLKTELDYNYAIALLKRKFENL